MTREFILEKLARNLASTPENRAKKAAGRIRQTEKGILPKQPRTRIARVNHFIAKAREAQASIATCGTEQLADAIGKWLRENNLPPDIRIGEDARLSSLHETNNNMLAVKQGPSDGKDVTGVSHAECGISETGTLVLLSGADNPTTLNFLPENHIVIVRRSDIASHYEDIWPRLRKRFGKGEMPRALNLVTGPSRSADIEQTLLLGAHGPVRLHILVTED
ncbi:LutC/YkgG family protein [Salaquimonas pukyongi]|uniref:LutC/YkgG family protein n=1 Tax=Salaquimonas pukyongi TaxID=2712698 RepID=UPI00096BCADC|nr:LUD domain-containing protein [Salaquimonas pukyongi]